MQARCPHCSNVFSTDRSGIQFCPNCGQQINVPDPAGTPPPSSAAGPGATLPPPPPPPPPGFGPPPPPPPPSGAGALVRQPTEWERRGELGLFQAFWQTWKKVIVEAEAFWRSVRPDGGLGDALLFGWICYAVNLVLQLPLNLAMRGLNQGQTEQLREAMGQIKDLPPEVRRQLENVLVSLVGGGGTVASVIFAAIAFPLGFIIWAAILHLFAMMFGAAKNGFNATARVVGYAYAPYLFGWVPCLGGVVAGIFSIVLMAWGLARVQDSTTGRGALAVLSPFALAICCCCVAVFALASVIAQAAGAR
jgi:hypothetical protein